MKSRTQNLINTALAQASKRTGRYVLAAFAAGALFALALLLLFSWIGALA